MLLGMHALAPTCAERGRGIVIKILNAVEPWYVGLTTVAQLMLRAWIAAGRLRSMTEASAQLITHAVMGRETVTKIQNAQESWYVALTTVKTTTPL